MTAVLALVAGCDRGGPPARPPPPDVTSGPSPSLDDAVVDVFVIGAVERRDVLWVVDDAVGAERLRDRLVAGLPGFLDVYLDSGLDWHLGVLSTDADDPDESGRLLVALTDTARDPLRALLDGFAGFGGEGAPQGLAAVRLAVETERQGANVGFFRDDAALELVLVTERDDVSPASAFPEGSFLDWLPSVPAAERAVSVLGRDRAGLAAATGGLAVPSGLPSALADLGLATSGLEQEFFLVAPPVPESLSVVVESEGVTFGFEPDQWTYDPVRNSVRFAQYVPSRDAVVRIRYEAAGP